jgi:hypothetical protein
VAAGRGRSRRVSLPGVAELLRPAAPGPDGGDQRRAGGREKHTHKITLYLSAEELLDLERARLAPPRYGAAASAGCPRVGVPSAGGANGASREEASGTSEPVR